MKRKLTVVEEGLRQKRCISNRSTPCEARASHRVAAAALQLAVKRKHIVILARASKRSAKDAFKNNIAARQFYERTDKASKLRRQLKAEKEKTAMAQCRYSPIRKALDKALSDARHLEDAVVQAQDRVKELEGAAP